MKFKIKKYPAAIFVGAIAILAFIFPYQIYIQDAISLENAEEFGIQISNWRILFEPILGLLTFFNRSLYAIEELIILLFWILGLYFSFTIIRLFTAKVDFNKKKFIIAQLVKLPLIVVIYFSIFVSVIFLELPNNTIVNNSETSVLVTTHSHTDFSHDGLISQKGLWEWHKRNNFDAFFITDHNNHAKTHELVEKQRHQKFPQEPLIMAGEEFSGTNHMSLLGIKNKFVTKGLSDKEAIDTTHFYKGVVIINHWFDGKGKHSLDYYKDLGVEGFEIENTAMELYYDRSIYKEIKNFCGVNKSIMVGGLDFHGYGRSCSIWNAFDIPNWKQLNSEKKEEAIIKIIRDRDQEKLKVLMYKDRPYYTQDNLMFSPLRTLFYYFRTLNLLQVISWAVWLLVFSFISKKTKGKKEMFIVLSSFIGVVFLFLLGAEYNSRIAGVKGYTKMYEEYGTLLFYVGSAFLVYTLLVAYFRFVKPKIKR
ncbi:MAG: hypothetical protein KAH07_01955 [Flavobacteriaceae bacterium]|nr:hypothetical protein [Flavobacteriaceae bacterium]